MKQTIHTLSDGPAFDHVENWQRRVTVERPSDVPGFYKCRDVSTKQSLVVHQTKLRAAGAVLALLFLLCAQVHGQLSISNPAYVAAVLKPPAPAGGSWTPATPANGLAQWSRWSDISGTPGNPVATWTAAAGQNFTGASGKQPLYRAGGPLSHQYLEFDGSDDGMVTAAWAAAVTQPYFLGIAWRKRAPAQGYLADGINCANPCTLLHATLSSDRIAQYFGSAVVYSVTGTDNTDWNHMLVRVDGATTTNWVHNAAPEGVGSSPGTASLTGLALGFACDGSGSANVDVLETAVWPGVLGTADIQSATNYLNSLIH